MQSLLLITDKTTFVVKINYTLSTERILFVIYVFYFPTFVKRMKRNNRYFFPFRKGHTYLEMMILMQKKLFIFIHLCCVKWNVDKFVKFLTKVCTVRYYRHICAFNKFYQLSKFLAHLYVSTRWLLLKKCCLLCYYRSLCSNTRFNNDNKL